ncbi:MAG: 50S ribosomal protein L19e [Candidatus Bathyarchaeota archaeon]
MKTGANSVWINPEKLDDVEGAITRVEIRRLIGEGTIRVVSAKGVSRSRARLLHEKKKRGLKKGAGSKTGKSTARMPRKESWKNRIRAIRAHLKELRAHRTIREGSYRKLYLMAKGGAFSSVTSIEQYVEANRLERRR